MIHLHSSLRIYGAPPVLAQVWEGIHDRKLYGWAKTAFTICWPYTSLCMLAILFQYAFTICFLVFTICLQYYFNRGAHTLSAPWELKLTSAWEVASKTPALLHTLRKDSQNRPISSYFTIIAQHPRASSQIIPMHCNDPQTIPDLWFSTAHLPMAQVTCRHCSSTGR